jgi:hypothetical protein
VGLVNGATVALDPATGQPAWFFSEGTSPDFSEQYSSPVYAGGKLYLGTGGTGFVCLDPDTRQVLWRLDFKTYFGKDYSDGVCTPACDQGLIYLPTANGHIFCLSALDGTVQWHVFKHAWKHNSVLLTDECLYTLNIQGSLDCRRKSDGGLVWSDKFTGTTDGNLAVCGGVLIVPGDSWRIWGIDLLTGRKVWCTTLTGNFARNSPFVVCGKVFISACHGDYYGLDGQTGKIEWRYYHGANLTFVQWAEADGFLFVANNAGKMYCFEPDQPGDPAACVCNLDGNWTPPPTATPALTPTPTRTGTPTATSTATPTSTRTPIPTRTPSPTPTVTPTPTPTDSPTDSPTPTKTATLTQTPTLTPTDSPTATASPASSLNSGNNCTFTEGYWKSHNKYAVKQSQNPPWPLSEETLLCGRTWFDILQTEPQGNDWFLLAHQWIASELNGAQGASVPPEVQTGMSEAATLLAGNCSSIPKNLTPFATDLSDLLEKYNSGRIGPGHCAENAPSAVIFPNPTNGMEPAYVQLPDYAGSMDVNMEVFTTAFRKVREESFSQVPGSSDIPLSLLDKSGVRLANGLYYVKIHGRLDRWTCKWLVLR